MTIHNSLILSVVVPVYNEAAGLLAFHESLVEVLDPMSIPYEILYCDDGSIDGTAALLQKLASQSPHIKIIRLSRNFGKELTTTAGLHAATGQAILMLDADGQHPVTSIPEFVAQWRTGTKVVVGRRTGRNAGFMKKYGSRLFYGVFGWATGIKMDSELSDFRLIDRSVQCDFNRMTERNRITRGLIDWLGYPRGYVSYHEKERLSGRSPYSFKKLLKLAVDSAISLSLSPLYLTAYIGAVVLPLSTILGIGMLVNYTLNDPLNLHATGGAYLMVLILFLLGILLVSQGIIGLYLSHIHTETQNRPLYIVDAEQSRGIV